MLPGGKLGRDFAEQLLQRRPDIPVVFISGRSSEIGDAPTNSLKASNVLPKPFSRSQSLNGVQEALGQSNKAAKLHESDELKP